ncbi:phage tail tape measure protein [Mesorhizobium sp. M00.F.Ca.ET.151.01.1.1]|nr:phage tail tape measure protein [bacterium M00.F.Ca.ET.199.01.1.1]TGT02994.1 phage tail tape measure protein [bacterium M00.F.Ca.ET.177.01.1.1]TGT57930.1 phage tail tape measure protein [Mesorhizobium sp. M00.F.Ca.ET.170.01.1.1]TGU06843.1 phage tail tape measure protein [bacterium M00.F.Ca.ET.163.01.1.1]TGU91544.1 phage tail tape measure protein [Mesorhizobium sp. M00.F.Ca.ET.151.01.1.1]TGV53232.1 phage tail tape measure protein [bacterium M00.F.Ca.ET.141.01.1.1]
MSGGNLRLQVVLHALDQATAPFRKVMAGSKGLASALQAQQATLRRLNNAQRDVSAYRQQQQALRGTEQSYQQAQARVAALARQMREAGTPTRKLSREFSQAKTAAAQLAAQHKQQQVDLQRLRSGLDRAGISTRQLGAHERRLRTDIAAASQQMEQQRARLAALDAAKVRSQKIYSSGMSAAAHGAGVALAALGALRAQGLPIAQAMDFESAMADVKKVVDFDTPDGFEKMGNDIQELSRRLPMVPNDIAKIVAAAGQAGIASNELTRFAEDAAKMGVAFDTTAEDAGQTMATWRTAFRMGQDDVVVLADRINYLGNTGPASVQKISEVVNRIGALGEVAGLGSGPLAALGATVAGMGIESEVSATGIKNMLLTLSSGDAATKRQVASFDKLGLKAGDLAKAMQDDAGGAILDVLEKLEQLPKAEQAATMTQLFGRESIGAIAPLLTNLDLLKENLGKVADEQKYGGSMNAEYAARVGTAENGLILLKNSAIVLSQRIGKTLLPTVKELAARVAKVADRMAEWVKNNPQLVATIAKLAIGGTALAAALGGLVVAGGVGAMALTQIHKAVMLLSGGGGLGKLVGQVLSLGGRAFPMLFNVGRMLLPLLGGISLPVLAIGAAIGVVAALVWKYWEPIKAFMIGTWQGIVDVVNPIMDELATALEPLGPVWDMVSDAMGKAWNWVMKLFAPFEATREQLQGATDAGRGFGQILGTVLTVNLRMAVKAIGWLVSAFTTILPVIQNAVGGAWTYLQGAWNLIVGLFTGNGDKIRSGLSAMWAGVNQILLGWPAQMMQAGIDMVQGLVNGIVSKGSAAMEAVAGIASGVVGKFKGMLGIHSPSRVFAQFGDFTMQGLAGGLNRSQGEPLSLVASVADRMKQAGAGIALGAVAMPVMAAASPVVSPGAAAAATGASGGSSYTIQITVAAGTDGQGIAAQVRAEIERIEREKVSRRASRLTD